MSESLSSCRLEGHCLHYDGWLEVKGEPPTYATVNRCCWCDFAMVVNTAFSIACGPHKPKSLLNQEQTK